MPAGRRIKFVAIAARWFDRSAGNTYHSVRVVRCSDCATIVHPMTYGYDDHYRQTALRLMARYKWLPPRYRKDNEFSYERENNYPVLWTVRDTTKRDCEQNGEK